MALGKYSLCALLMLVASGGVDAAPARSIALHGKPLYADDFKAFAYTNPSAPKAGKLTLGVLGSYENVNPLIVGGTPASGIREFVVEALMARSLDEPFTLYGLLAETIDVADDRKSVTFALNPAARFSDGTPVTAEDVITSFELLKAKGRPNHRTYFAKVTKAEKVGDRSVRFSFEDATDRELPLILGLMPVFAAHATTAEKFASASMTPLLGSGPYTVDKIDAGRSIIYRRDPNYWGKDLPVNRGRFNFDEIRFDYYRDASSMFEAFKAGNIDLRLEEDPGRWATGYNIPSVRDGRIIKAEFDIGLPAGMTALVFNTRRSVFADPLVRRALIMLFDFEWCNRTLYNGLYSRTESYFERSYLASTGHPADAYERKLLEPFPGAVRPEILEGTYRFPQSDGSGQDRPNQKKAFALLKEAGMVLKSGRMVNGKTGEPLAFEILANSNAQEALLLSYARSLAPLGIQARVRVVDSAQYQARLIDYDYDMIQNTWQSSLSPGNEQLFRWSAKTADAKGSFNYAGVKNPAADAMIGAMLAAESEQDFVSSVRALDRVLLSGDYVVPLFYTPRQWVPYWARLKHPEKTPLFGYAVDTWWTEPR
ncbi:extracellular solute-binding protein [Hyphomicrobium sp.]|uniref:extracellular solute-binding protein n=1 Tax=Hyphomicrobium sp. TaxID=82 RepID=UPI000FA1EE55|nr:extracellular solute-binding protein [Hyphomicrobium sp.]RUO97204.1 MAG: ABC transporter substrate-binding protein [Hyphomicrobium sp.]